jgi:cardiolipin synthase
MWDAIKEVMKEKAAQGVDVRVMYDDIGSFVRVDKDTPQELAEAGIQCRLYNPFHPIITSAQNNRDHRKVLSIDGKVAFTGGINIADEYINEIDRFGHWKDTGIKMEGPGAWGQTLIFLQLWQSMDKQLTDESIATLIPTFNQTSIDTSKGFVQPYADSPTDLQNVGEHVFMKMIHEAKRSVHIFTPYLILDENLETALILAAQSGLDVKIVTPENPDKYLVHVTTRSYYLELLEAGVKIYEYTDGFMHAKSVIVDDDAAVIGTINFDYRSLYLHFENAVALYGSPVIEDMKKDFEQTITRSTQIHLEDVNKTFLVRLTKSILRLFAPLM